MGVSPNITSIQKQEIQSLKPAPVLNLEDIMVITSYLEVTIVITPYLNVIIIITSYLEVIIIIIIIIITSYLRC